MKNESFDVKEFDDMIFKNEYKTKEQREYDDIINGIIKVISLYIKTTNNNTSLILGKKIANRLGLTEENTIFGYQCKIGNFDFGFILE